MSWNLAWPILFVYTLHRYIKRYMGAPTGVDVEALQVENEDLRRRAAELEDRVAQLNAQV